MVFDLTSPPAVTSLSIVSDTTARKGFIKSLIASKERDLRRMMRELRELHDELRRLE